MSTDQDIDELVNDAPAPKEQTEAQKRIVAQAKRDHQYGMDWEAVARTRFDYDDKFANGDAHNMFQWDQDILAERDGRPCLTVNKTQQHNLMIINDAKQNKPGVRIRPVGDEATYEAAQIYQEIVYHVEYISNAENIYDSAVTWAVNAGIGYWQVVTEPISVDSFDQEIKIKRVKDPRSVLLDPDINDVDGSDARWGQIFEDVPKSLFKEEYPSYANIVGTSTLDSSFVGNDGWTTQNHIRLCKYYRKEQKKDKLVAFTTDDGMQIVKRVSQLQDVEKLIWKEVKRTAATREHYQYRERNVVTDNITVYTIAGDYVVKEDKWLGKYIPIVRLPGTETVIDGILDRKGHTRALINPQQIYNYNTSSDVEFGALQTKVPWLVAADQIGEYGPYWDTANTKNHAYLPYEHLDANGDPFPHPPQRPVPPQPSPAYAEGRKVAQNEMMMASGQYQAQFGEAENAKSGVAINARQRQGDRATYHFIDNQAIAIRFTGKIIIDLIPKIYDTKRVMRITATDGSIMNVTVDPDAPQAMQKVDSPPLQPTMDKDQIVQEVIFNPNIGMYDVQADSGPSFATKRMEAAAALMQLASSDKMFMERYADFLFETLDFSKAAAMAERAKKFLPPNVLGQNDPTADPRVQDIMHKASDHIEQLTKELGATKLKLESKEKELTIKAQTLDLNFRKEGSAAEREDYKAETERLTALGNSGPAISQEMIAPVVMQLIRGMMANGELHVAPAPHEGGTPIQLPAEATGEAPAETAAPSGEEEQPPIPGARKAGKDWFVEYSPGKYAKVEPNAPATV